LGGLLELVHQGVASLVDVAKCQNRGDPRGHNACANQREPNALNNNVRYFVEDCFHFHLVDVHFHANSVAYGRYRFITAMSFLCDGWLAVWLVFNSFSVSFSLAS
jgi:hypothetical protein